MHPDLCCLGQAYALWRLQWNRELKWMMQYVMGQSLLPASAEIRLPNLAAAQLSLVSSFQQWVYALAVIQEAYQGAGAWMVIDGVGGRPYWALLQEDASFSCPIHFRHPALSLLGRCDHGRILRQEHQRRHAAMRDFERWRQAKRQGGAS